MNILGISAFYHDSAACLVRDGKIVSAVQEERFSRVKHDPSFPNQAIESCLKEAGIKKQDLDFVAFYDKPFIKFERILQTYLTYAPWGIRPFIKSIPAWIKQKLWIKDIIGEALGDKAEILFLSHHESHAASAFFPSPFKESAFLTVDGVGEWATSSFGIGKDSRIKMLSEIHFPHSLGLLYSAFTYYTGFKVNSGEYKLMGLAPYGNAKYKNLILSELIDLKEDGSFKLNMKYFNYCSGLTMTNRRFHKLFGRPPRKPESKISQFYMDIAKSIQEVTEEVILRMAGEVHRKTGRRNLCLAGGVALNCVANGRVLREGPFDKVWIQPASSDAGGALGAALFVWYQYLNNERPADNEHDFQQASLLGPSFSREDILRFLDKRGVSYTEINEEDIAEKTADLIASEKVVGWFQGKMEFGPRALGNRSILGDARSLKMQEIINLKIKFRESFRPFAPSVLKERVLDYFSLDRESPYMLLTAEVKEGIRIRLSSEEKNMSGFGKLKCARSTIPAVTHVDFSARVQTVNKNQNPLYHKLLEAFDRKYGCPVIINTSFNVRGEPIVMTPEDAYKCFMRTNMDYLVIGPFLIEKKEQKPLDKDIDWLKEFELD